MVSSEIDAPGRYTALAKFPVTTAAIPAVNLVFLEEYLSTVYEPDAKFVDDVIEERAARRRQSFRVAGGPLQLLLHAGMELEPARAPLAPYPGVGNPLPGPRRRSPQRRCPRQQIATHPPLSIFEIPSSEDRHKLLLVRLADFERMGVPSIYVIDPGDGAMLRFHAASSRRRLVSTSLRVGSTSPTSRLPRSSAGPQTFRIREHTPGTRKHQPPRPTGSPTLPVPWRDDPLHRTHAQERDLA